MGQFFAVFVLATGTLLVGSVPVLVVAQRSDRLDVSRRFMGASVLIGLLAGLATLAGDTGDAGFAGALVLVCGAFFVVVLVTAVAMSRD